MQAREKGRPSLPRVPSYNRQTSVAAIAAMARWQRFLCAGVLFTSGILCGHVIHQLFLWKLDVQHPVRSIRQIDGEEMPQARTITVPGSNRRKDFGVQFRDYIPGHYFIHCGGSFPTQVEVFLDTYPRASDYRIVTLLADESYAPLYAKFRKHRLLTPATPTGRNGTTELLLKGLGQAEPRPTPVPGLDLAAYIRDTLHDDDHVVLLLDIPGDQERQVAGQLVALSSLELVDKYYTTSSDSDVIGNVTKAFSGRGLKVLTWSPANLTYSDFRQLHPPQAPPGASKVVRDCQGADDSHVTLFLFASAHTPAASAAVEVLLSATRGRPAKAPLAVFLPASLLTSLGPDRLQRLYTVFDGGLYLGPVTPDDVSRNPGNTTSDEEMLATVCEDVYEDMVPVRLRNAVVGAELRFQEAGLLMKHVLASPKLRPLTSRLISETRRLNVFTHLDDVSQLAVATSGPSPLALPPSPRGNIRGLDLVWPDSPALALVLLQQLETRMLPLEACLKAGG